MNAFTDKVKVDPKWVKKLQHDVRSSAAATRGAESPARLGSIWPGSRPCAEPPTSRGGAISKGGQGEGQGNA